MENTIRQGRMERMTAFCRKGILALAMLSLMAMNVVADIEVTDLKVFSGYPWREIAIGYTIKGTDTGTDADGDVIQLKATDKSANKTYTVQPLAGATLTEGRHVVRWNAASEGVEFSSSNVEFSVSIVRLGVQLWENGPYWAEYNVGASRPEESGYYFWWGDTVGCRRSNDGWVSVANGDSFTFVDESCPTCGMEDSQLQSEGYIDSTGNLVAKYDAATQYFGSRWRMPTDAEWKSLIEKCTTRWTNLNGVSGMLVTGRGTYATKNIFLPAAGIGLRSALFYLGGYGRYWSSTPASGNSYYAMCLYLSSDRLATSGMNNREVGQHVRPVRGFAQ